MMKPTGLSKKKETTDQTTDNQITVQSGNSKSSKDPPVELMNRLAKGEKAEITKKDMLKLTTKNYEQLPEVKKKRE